ncbi:MAG TPA: hypothetical protein VLG45_08390 [Thermodesulfobacteriota bacterium]|nr:hypothetical protein [Thermodesulfobacteriota bacterium]
MKKVYMIGTFYVLLVFVLYALSISLLAAAQEGALDGKTFAGEMGETGKKKGDKDELIFKDGKFSSEACEKYGFGDAPYTTTASGGATTFEADTVSVKEGKMHWSGTVKGDELTGTVVWTKEGQAPIDYWFASKLKK